LKRRKKNAAQSLAEAIVVADFNPSTRIHELIDYIQQLGAPVLLPAKLK